jgi:hypothetical protein
MTQNALRPTERPPGATEPVSRPHHDPESATMGQMKGQFLDTVIIGVVSLILVGLALMGLGWMITNAFN